MDADDAATMNMFGDRFGAGVDGGGDAALPSQSTTVPARVRRRAARVSGGGGSSSSSERTSFMAMVDDAMGGGGSAAFATPQQDDDAAATATCSDEGGGDGDDEVVPCDDARGALALLYAAVRARSDAVVLDTVQDGPLNVETGEYASLCVRARGTAAYLTLWWAAPPQRMAAFGVGARGVEVSLYGDAVPVAAAFGFASRSELARAVDAALEVAAAAERTFWSDAADTVTLRATADGMVVAQHVPRFPCAAGFLLLPDGRVERASAAIASMRADWLAASGMSSGSSARSRKRAAAAATTVTAAPPSSPAADFRGGSGEHAQRTPKTAGTALQHQRRPQPPQRKRSGGSARASSVARTRRLSTKRWVNAGGESPAPRDTSARALVFSAVACTPPPEAAARTAPPFSPPPQPLFDNAAAAAAAPAAAPGAAAAPSRRSSAHPARARAAPQRFVPFAEPPKTHAPKTHEPVFSMSAVECTPPPPPAPLRAAAPFMSLPPPPPLLLLPPDAGTAAVAAADACTAITPTAAATRGPSRMRAAPQRFGFVRL